MMPHALDPHYQDFGGLDTRTNPLQQNPKYARDGINFRFNYQDELTEAQGFQHRLSADFSWGLMEYRFRDPDTGEAKSEILGIDASGNLKKIVYQYLEFQISGGEVSFYSLFYDENVPATWKIIFYNTDSEELGSVDFVTSDSLQELSTAINSLSLSGLLTQVVDENGVITADEFCLAYQLETVIMKPLSLGTTQSQGFYTEQILSAQSPAFPLVVSQANNPEYEGPTWQNHNNNIYITDGGWVYKYDGKSVYRAGIPASIKEDPGDQESYTPGTAGNGSGFRTGAASSPSGIFGLSGVYKYLFRFGFRDYNGASYFGLLDENKPFTVTSSMGQSPAFYVPSFGNPVGFPIYTAKVNGDHTFPSTQGSDTITVDSGHNIQIGMTLMIASVSASSVPGGLSTEQFNNYWMATVSSTTSTSITIDSHPLSGSPNSSYLLDNQTLAAYFSPSDSHDQYLTSYNGETPNPFGFFVQVFRTKDGASSPFYRLCEVPMPISSSQEYIVYDEALDERLIEELVDQEVGYSLPRSCRYLSRWQNTLIQAGRPYDSSILKGEGYPSFYHAAKYIDYPYFPVKYSESGLCDFQSIYWASQDAPEGFPQDGLNELSIDTNFNDEIRGMAPNKDSFFAFKTRSTGYVTGSLATNEVALEVMEVDAGCACHKSVQEVQGAIFYMDENYGFWSIVAGRLPIFVGYAIQDFFKHNTRGLNFRRAVATNFREQDKYICYIPGASPITFAYDYAATASGTRTAWYPWDLIDAGGGILATADGKLFASSKSSSLVWQQKLTDTKYDYSIHESPIPWRYVGSWINFGKPIINKRFTKVWINSIQGGFNLLVTQYANYLSPQIGAYPLQFIQETPEKKGIKNWMNTTTDNLNAISIGFENDDIYANVRIQGWEIEYAPDFDINEGRK